MPESSKPKLKIGGRVLFSKVIWLALLASAGLFLALFGTQYSFEGFKFWTNDDEAGQEVPDNVVLLPAPSQPISFSHKQHVKTLAFECVLCHVNADPGVKMGFPGIDTCLSCHMTVGKDESTLEKLSELEKLDEQTPWSRVYEIPERPIWSHRAHAEAGMACITCHGDVSTSDEMAEITATTSMASCIGCHESHNVSSTCITCHAWPPDPLHPMD